MSSVQKKTKKKKEPKKEVKKDLTPQLVTCDLADNTYSGIIREDHLGTVFLESTSATYQWATGAKYEGPFVSSQIEGRGKFSWPDGSTYEGELLGGKRHGEGTFVAKDGSTRYEGQWSHGKRDGQGKLTYNSDGTSYYEGGWHVGQKHGFGKQLWPSGNGYEGQWKLGKMSGTGTMTWRYGSSAEKYTGDWVDNCPHGEGTHTWMVAEPSAPEGTSESWLRSPPPSAGPLTKVNQLQPADGRKHDPHQMHQHQQLNNRYTGQWVWGRREGKGTFYYANGAYYHGDWKHHKKDGSGRHTFDDGKVYEGPFEADRMTEYSKPPPVSKNLGSLEDNPICSQTDISDLETVLLPMDNSGFPLTSGAGYTDPVKILKCIYNMLLRHLGEMREAYARSRSAQPLLGEDPYVMTSCQFWHLAREAGLLTPACPIARFDRAIFSGPRHHCEISPDAEDDLRPLTPRVSEHRSSLDWRPEATGHLRSSLQMSSAQANEESGSQGGNSEETSSMASSLPSPVGVEQGRERNGGSAGGEEAMRKNSFPEPEKQTEWGNAHLGKKFLRSSPTGGNLANIHSAARPLLFRQFLEGFVRLAPARFPNERGLEPQVQRLFKEQVMPSFKAASVAARPQAAGLSGSFGNERHNPLVFGLFTQSQVQDVVRDVEPALWKTFLSLSGDENAEATAENRLFGGGVLAGIPSLRGKTRDAPNPTQKGGAPNNTSDAATLPSLQDAAANAAKATIAQKKDSGKKASTGSRTGSISIQIPHTDAHGPETPNSGLLSGHSDAIRFGDWGAPCRKLHVLARFNSTVRIKDIFKLLDSVGLLKTLPPSKDMLKLPLHEVLLGQNGDAINVLLSPLGTGLEAEELAEGDQSEDEDGSGGSAAPEEDILEEKKLGGGKPLPGLANLSFMPAASLLGGGSKKEEEKKKKAEKEKKQKEKEKETEKDIYRTPADDLAQINLMVEALDVLRMLSQSLSPSSLEMLRWEIEPTPPPDDDAVDTRVSVLEFMETEVVFAEFLRFFFLLAELTTRRDSKFCRGLTIQTRFDTYMRGMLLTHLQAGTRYMPPEAPAPVPPAPVKAETAKPKVDDEDAEDQEEAPAVDEEKPEEEEEEPPPVVEEVKIEPPKFWRGLDGKAQELSVIVPQGAGLQITSER
eukprot:CAMPEP_0197658096 /NCGR_PEP_ID=MMETSP1338-20131121/45026_1 /TAXON_ID=43686 ORGANISM="Pelagodinium beii, Strain RCC1491" /NCGR_SAMPLE_ID=MMETSP1338 /ASSEMBLY_ACC=CAM_ASM_000754 /LENGTH=1144 /DNA_ID=CAMNT_0043234607 /DNA_START=73 /DNA_END=3508 /DNA_ORIENTATION=+